jgi:hypothetical protein
MSGTGEPGRSISPDEVPRGSSFAASSIPTTSVERLSLVGDLSVDHT